MNKFKVLLKFNVVWQHLHFYKKLTYNFNIRVTNNNLLNIE